MDPGTLIAFLVILVLSGFFSGTETALTAVSDVSIHQLVEKGDKRAKIVEHMLRDRRRVISTLLIANNIVNVVLAVLASLVFGEMLAGVGPAWLGPVVASAGAIIALLIFGEVVPKTMAISFSTRWSLFSAYPTVVLVVIFRPLAWALTVMSHGMMRLTGRKGGAGDDDVLTVGHIQTFAKIGASEGVIDSLETELIHRAAELNDSRVREIMIPRTDIFAVESGSDLASIKAMFQTTPLSRIPVYRGDLDEIIGVLNYKEVLRMGATVSQRFNLRSYLHPPMFVPESMFIGDLLNEMRTKKTHLAIVCDEYGGTSGLVTLEDVMEMLVGKIEDEYDVEANLFEALDQTSWAVDGRLSIDEFLSETGIEMEEKLLEGFDTVAGLALKAFGNIPADGQITTYHNLEITVTRVRGHRVRRLKIRKLQPAEADQAKVSRRTSKIRNGDQQ